MKLTQIMIACACLSMCLTTSCSTLADLVAPTPLSQVASANKILATITDKSTADAAAPEVTKYASAIKEEIMTLTNGGQMSKLEMANLYYQYKTGKITDSAGELINQYIRLSSNNFYGSSDLQKALNSAIF